MHRYRVRPGYGSRELLIEFDADPEDEGFVHDLLEALSGGGYRYEGSVDRVLAQSVVLRGRFGTIEIDVDEWRMVWIHAVDSQNAISHVDGLLAGSGRFAKQPVDPSRYR